MNAQPDALLLPPHAREAEQSVLGGLLLDPEAIDRVGDLITSADFFSVDHAHIFDAILALAENGKAVDVVTLHQHLVREGTLDAVGGLEYLGELVHNVPTAANIRHYAQLVRDRRIERDLLAASWRLGEIAYGKGPLAQRLDQAQALIMGLTETASTSEPKPVRASLLSVIDGLEARYNGEANVLGVPTGLADLDRKLSGMQDGDLIVLAGRPSMGKSVLALQIARNAALHGTPALVFSLEMDATQCAERDLVATARVDAERIRHGKGLTNDDWERISGALGRLSEVPLYHDDSADCTVQQMRAKARRMKRLHNIGLIVVDYLQLMSGSGESRREEVDSISRGLKLMAKELKVPIVALSQLNRALEQRTNKRPMLSDLRESGGIEQDADVVVFLYRDEVYNPDTEATGVVELIVAKQRQGPTGTVYATWLGEFYAIADRAEPYSPTSRAPQRPKRQTLMSGSGM